MKALTILGLWPWDGKLSQGRVSTMGEGGLNGQSVILKRTRKGCLLLQKVWNEEMMKKLEAI